MTEEKTNSNEGLAKNVTVKASDTITIKKDDLWKYSTFILAALVIVGAFVMFGGDGDTAVIGNQPADVQPGPPAQAAKVTADADDDARIGPADAPVEIIEFSDFQCPFCSRAVPTIKQIIAEYGDKVTFVYRDFPLDSIHPMATPAAIAAECVRAQSDDATYFEYHDKIFAGQGGLSNDNLKIWAQELGYDIGSCLDSQEFLDEVKKDLADGQAAGARGTPYFVINGVPLSGAQPFSAFKQIIDAELA